MLKTLFALFIFIISGIALRGFEQDTIKTNSGNLVITFIGHGSLMFNFNNKIIHVDPFGKLTDYTRLPDADIIIITHHHGDHLDTSAIEKILTGNTRILLTKEAMKLLTSEMKQKNKFSVIKNGDTITLSGIQIDAVPAYNIVHKRDDGEPYHPKGTCNGYVISFGDKRIYVAGDTENIPEMKNLKNIDIAFLPMNLPYTMTPEMAAQAAKTINPKIFYPYHYGESNVSELVDLMKDRIGIEVRIRKME